MFSITVIIPVYNGEQFLEQCLDSVLEQDIENKEIICIDDGSIDNSVAIVKKYQATYPEIRLIQQKNSGAAIARNKALDVATGKYIAFMDADDIYIDKTGLRRMVEECERNQMLICGSLRQTLTDKGLVPADAYTYRSEFVNDNSYGKKLKFIDFQYDYYYQSYIFRRDFLDENNLRFPNLRRYQDPPFLVQALWAAQEFIVLPIELYGYRVRVGEIKYSFIQVNDTLRGIKENILFAIRHNLNVLLNNTVRRLNQDFFNAVRASISNGNMIAVKLLIETREIIENSSIAIEENLRIMQKIENDLHNSMTWVQEYKFPFADIPFGSNIALYGAGAAGRYLKYLIDKIDYCNIVLWVDKNFQLLQLDGLEVKSPKELQMKAFDYILIAVEKEMLFNEIKKSIKDQGWDNHKKIIGPIKKNDRK